MHSDWSEQIFFCNYIMNKLYTIFTHWLTDLDLSLTVQVQCQWQRMCLTQPTDVLWLLHTDLDLSTLTSDLSLTVQVQWQWQRMCPTQPTDVVWPQHTDLDLSTLTFDLSLTVWVQWQWQRMCSTQPTDVLCWSYDTLGCPYLHNRRGKKSQSTFTTALQEYLKDLKSSDTCKNCCRYPNLWTKWFYHSQVKCMQKERQAAPSLFALTCLSEF